MLPPLEFRATPKQAARLLGCHVSLIYRALRKRRLTAWRVAGSRYLLDSREVMGLVEVLKARAG